MNLLSRIGLATLVLASSGTVVAAERPSTEEIAKARADCHVQTVRLEQLERSAAWCTDDRKLLQTRDAAEHSCGHSEDLLIAAGIEPKAAQPQAAPAVPSLTIREQVPAASAEPAQFAAMEVDRRCERRATR
jgi:hypothetical protein